MDALSLACDLVAIPSVSQVSNAPAADVVERWLRQLGAEVERLQFIDPQGETKVSVVGRLGTGSGGLAYFAHSDVVPATTWSIAAHGPFSPTVRDGRLYGRGSCDMKGSVAAFFSAVSRIKPQELTHPVYIIVTADEEIGFHGARQVVEQSQLYAELVAGEAMGIIGEPTELKVVHGHKGGYGFRAISRGRAGHSSTREGVNANLAMIPFLMEMKRIHDETLVDPEWLHDEFDPPWISWNIGINDHTAAVNITPPQSICTVAFRPMPGQQPSRLMDRARQCAEEHGIAFEVMWELPPLYTDPQQPLIRELLEMVGQPASRTVAFGTDGSLFGAVAQLAVIGPGSVAQAHTDDEWLCLDQLERGVDLYERMIRRWCTGT